jgi:hypothetical protein
MSLLLGPLVVVSFLSESCLFAVIWLGAQSLLFFVLPVTICIALFGRHRCRNCGLRFPPSRSAESEGTNEHFPWFAHALNMALVLLLCLVGPIVLRNWGGRGMSDMMSDVGNVMLTGVLLWVSMAYQIVVYRKLALRIRKPLIWMILFAWPGVVLGGVSLYGAAPAVRARAMLARADLAALPESATALRIYEWSSPFSGEEFLRFAAEPNDIERFLDESPILRGKTSRRYKIEPVPWLVPEETALGEQDEEADPRLLLPHPNGPKWYRPGLDHPARRYEIQPEGYHYPGEVIVDDEQNVVYVYLCFS